MEYKSKQYKNLMNRILSIYNVGEGDEVMANKLSRLSGMKGAEKKTKDKIGKSLNRNEIVDKIYKRLDKKIRGQNDC